MSVDEQKHGAARPFFKHSVAQLEKLFGLGAADRQLLTSLQHELGFRSTDRARRLRDKVAVALRAMPRMPTSIREAGQASEAKERLTTGIGPVGGPITPQDGIEPAGRKPSSAAPQSDDEPGAILAAWTAMEALSPQTYRHPEDMAGGDRACVAPLTSDRLPWQIGERSRPNKQLYYQVILGAIPMDRATERLVAAFGDDEERPSYLRDKAALAAVLVDRNGNLIEERGIAVSSFGWALPIALRRNLGALGAWPSVEPAVIDGLATILRRTDRHGKTLPLDAAVIGEAHRWLVAKFGLADGLVEPPSFALRVYHYYRAKNGPEVPLLNSFFMGDLARAAAAVRRNEASRGFRQYLGIDKPTKTCNLLADLTALEQAVAPARLPPARWPSPGGHALVLLQQAAVNLARSELAGKEGMVAVNGPPGTGKTTLLRDVVSSCVLDRAMAMAAFDDPETAFTPSGQKLAFGEGGFLHLYTLAPSLKGHEVLVASSNNKAVENISRELPGLKAVGRAPEELSYFRSVSDLIHGPKSREETGELNDGSAAEPVETWGMIAAVLGNRSNVAAFQQSFWWHDDRSFRLYLKAAKGDSVVKETRDPETGALVERRTPSIVALENPPTPATAKANWRAARQRLLTLKQSIDAELKALEAVRQLCVDLAEGRRAVAHCETEGAELSARRTSASKAKLTDEHGLRHAREEHARHATAVNGHRKRKPWFWSAWMGTSRWKDWSQTHGPLAAAASSAAIAAREAEAKLTQSIETLAQVDAAIVRNQALLKNGQQKVTGLSMAVDGHRQQIGDRMVDAALFDRGNEAVHLTAPWVSDSLHRQREELFAAALGVHRAFVDASAQKVYHNLGVLMDTLSNGPPTDEAKRKLIGDLWSTLFMTLPVVSTTFASVYRMMGALPNGSIGWLLIDEAGQALPQAAVGAIMRAKRSVVVGDPLQIPPVVTLPQQLTAQISAYFKVDHGHWIAPEASAQTLADRASKFQGEFRSPQGPRRVGVPLVAHRRCQEPMFGIFNRIAYDGQMIQATPAAQQNQIGSALGPSRWLDVDGEADSKWCPAEGDAVVTLLKKLAQEGITQPDLFVVTPFRIVAQELRRRLEQEHGLFTALGVEARSWARDRVGTIHTVQGREADVVVLVLGAPKPIQSGARNWAAGTPNIFNVAVSRARQNLYVVGSRGAWAGMGHGRDLAVLPAVKVGIDPDDPGLFGPDIAAPEIKGSKQEHAGRRRSPLMH